MMSREQLIFMIINQARKINLIMGSVRDTTSSGVESGNTNLTIAAGHGPELRKITKINIFQTMNGTSSVLHTDIQSSMLYSIAKCIFKVVFLWSPMPILAISVVFVCYRQFLHLIQMIKSLFLHFIPPKLHVLLTNLTGHSGTSANN